MFNIPNATTRKACFPPHQLKPFLSSTCVSITVVAHKETSQYQFNPWTAGIYATLLQKEYDNLSLSPYIFKILMYNSGYIKKQNQKPPHTPLRTLPMFR